MTFSWPWALLSLLVVPIVLGLAWWSRAGASARRSGSPRSRWCGRRCRGGPAGRAASRPRCWCSDWPRWASARPGRRPRCRSRRTPPPSCWRWTRPARCARPTCYRTGSRSPRRRRSRSSSRQHGGVRIGLVTFAGVAGLLVPPTTDSDALITAIQNLSTARGTAIGAAMLTAIDGIAAVDPSVAPSGVDLGTAAAAGYAPDVIVLLTDGANTQGVEPADGGGTGCCPRDPRLHHRIRYHHPDADGLHRHAGRRLLRRRRRRRWRWLPAAVAVADGEPADHRRARAAGRGQNHRWTVLPGAERRPADRSPSATCPATSRWRTRRSTWPPGSPAIGGLIIAVAVGLSLWLNRIRMPRPRVADR